MSRQFAPSLLLTVVFSLVPSILPEEFWAETSSIAWAADPPAKTLVVPGETFWVAERPAFLFHAAGPQRRSPQPWVLYAPTLAPYPDAHEKWLHERITQAGVAVAGIDMGEAYGSPQGNEGLTKLYEELVGKRGFSPKPCLLGRSRGGLWVTSWAAANPEKVAGVAGIYPVFDFRTYPGIARAAPAYGVSAEELQRRAPEWNPIERVSQLAKARIPAFLIHGDVDKVVPLRENSAEFLARYQAAGAGDSVRLVVAEGQGHNFWPGFFQNEEFVAFVIRQATGAKD